MLRAETRIRQKRGSQSRYGGAVFTNLSFPSRKDALYSSLKRGIKLIQICNDAGLPSIFLNSGEDEEFSRIAENLVTRVIQLNSKESMKEYHDSIPGVPHYCKYSI